MTTVLFRKSLALALFLTAFSVFNSTAQDPTKIAPNNYKVIFENDKARLLEVKIQPGEKIPMHSHPEHLIYVLNGEKVKFTAPNGKTLEIGLKNSEARWNPVDTHSTENIGTSEIHVLVFELKKKHKKSK